MTNVSMHSTRRVQAPSRLTPIRVVAAVVAMALAAWASGLGYCYFTSSPPTPRDALYPRLPMHPF